MADTPMKIPNSPKRGSALKAIQKLQEATNTLKGATGDPLDRAVTLRELVDSGIASLPYTIQPVRNSPRVILPPTSPGALPNRGIPPKVTGLSATGFLEGILVSWDSNESYQFGAYFEVLASDTDNPGNALVVGKPAINQYFHAIPGGLTRYYWVRLVSTAGVRGPLNATAGVAGTSLYSAEYVVGQLTGLITNTHLHADLGSRIDLIDDPFTGLWGRAGIIYRYSGAPFDVGLVNSPTIAQAVPLLFTSPMSGTAVIRMNLTGVSGGIHVAVNDVELLPVMSDATEAPTHVVSDQGTVSLAQMVDGAVNLLPGVWVGTNATVTPNAGADPDGGNAATQISDASAVAAGYASQAIDLSDLVAGGTYTASVLIKKYTASLVLPGAPANLVATPAALGIQLTWDAVAGAVSYDLFWSTSTGVTEGATSLTSVASGYLHEGRTPGVTYYYKVRANMADGAGPLSTEVSATLMDPTAVPLNVAAEAGDTQVTITWDPVPGATAYRIYWDTVAGVDTLDTVVSPATSPHAVTGLSNGTPHYFRVLASALGVDTGLSAEVTATPVSGFTGGEIAPDEILVDPFPVQGLEPLIAAYDDTRSLWVLQPLGSGRFSTSPDRVTWTEQMANPIPPDGTLITATGGVWIIDLSANGLAWSTDAGASWTSSTTFGGGAAVNIVNAVLYGGKIIANSTTKVYYATLGTQAFTEATAPAFFAQAGGLAATSSGLRLATSIGLLESATGETWSLVPGTPAGSMNSFILVADAIAGQSAVVFDIGSGAPDPKLWVTPETYYATWTEVAYPAWALVASTDSPKGPRAVYSSVRGHLCGVNVFGTNPQAYYLLGYKDGVFSRTYYPNPDAAFFPTLSLATNGAEVLVAFGNRIFRAD